MYPSVTCSFSALALASRKQVVHLLHVRHRNGGPSHRLGENVRRYEHLHRVPEAGARDNARQQLHHRRLSVQSFRCSANGENLTHFRDAVAVGRDNQEAVEQVDGNAVRCQCIPVVTAVDVRDAAIGRQHDNGRNRRFQTAIEVREALHVEHVDFVDEQHARVPPRHRRSTFARPC